MSNEFVTITAPIARETDKAVMFECVMACVATDQHKKVGFWAPKSLMQGQQIKAWFFEKKLRELRGSWAGNVVFEGLTEFPEIA